LTTSEEAQFSELSKVDLNARDDYPYTDDPDRNEEDEDNVETEESENHVLVMLLLF
jgi:hypothetical protein